MKSLPKHELLKKLCHCIKKVRKTIKLRKISIPVMSKLLNDARNQINNQKLTITQKTEAYKKINILSKLKKKTELAKESAAIGVCVKSVLHGRGKTLKKFSCKQKKLILQSM